MGKKTDDQSHSQMAKIVEPMGKFTLYSNPVCMYCQKSPHEVSDYFEIEEADLKIFLRDTWNQSQWEKKHSAKAIPDSTLDSTKGSLGNGPTDTSNSILDNSLNGTLEVLNSTPDDTSSSPLDETSNSTTDDSLQDNEIDSGNVTRDKTIDTSGPDGITQLDYNENDKPEIIHNDTCECK